MKQIIFLICIAALSACKKDKVPQPQQSMAVQDGVLQISAGSNFPGSGGNQLEYSIDGGDTTIISFKTGITIDTAISTGQTYFVKVSSLDYSQKVYADIGFSGRNLKSDYCNRNPSTPNNCSITLTGIIP